jgi:hypothetical protein
MISRRELARFAALLPLSAAFMRPAFAQYGGGAGMPNNGVFNAHDPALYGPVTEPPPELADWFEKLKRPDVEQDMRDTGSAHGQVISCCDAGDAYPIEILEEAYPPHTGTEENGLARVKDGSQRQVKKPNGEYKYRMEITGSLSFHFSGNKLTREKEGNPTNTAWAFLSILGGEIHRTYCIVPLPPSM